MIMHRGSMAILHARSRMEGAPGRVADTTWEAEGAFLTLVLVLLGEQLSGHACVVDGLPDVCRRDDQLHPAAAVRLNLPPQVNHLAQGRSTRPFWFETVLGQAAGRPQLFPFADEAPALESLHFRRLHDVPKPLSLFHP